MLSKYTDAIKAPSQNEVDEERLWVQSEIARIGKAKLEELVTASIEARKSAYTPYSNYAVGAAVLCSSGKVYSAPNAEVVTFSQTGHAEGNAVSKAISEGEAKENRKFIEAIVVCHSGESGPCGSCRQIIAEHCDNALVIDIDPDGNPVTVTSLKILLPFAFTPSHLSKVPNGGDFL